jgi:hypothetical protein
VLDARLPARPPRRAPGLELRSAFALRAADTALARLEGVEAKVADLMGIIERARALGRIANDPEFPEDANIQKILKRTPLRVIGHPQDDEP